MRRENNPAHQTTMNQQERDNLTDAEQAMLAIGDSGRNFFDHVRFEGRYAHISYDGHEIKFECDDVDLYPLEVEIPDIAEQVGIDPDMFAILELYNRETPTVDEPIECGGMVRLPERTFDPDNAADIVDEYGIEVSDMGTDWFTIRTFYPDAHSAEIGFGHYPETEAEP